MLIFNWIVVVLDVAVAITIMVGLRTFAHHLPATHKLGLWVGAIGLFAQALRSLQFIILGVSPTDNDLPLWVLKDMGYWVIALVVLINVIKKIRCKYDK